MFRDEQNKLGYCHRNGMAEVRAVSAALHTPNWGARCHWGPKILVPSPLSTPEKASIPQIEI